MNKTESRPTATLDEQEQDLIAQYEQRIKDLERRVGVDQSRAIKASHAMSSKQARDEFRANIQNRYPTNAIIDKLKPTLNKIFILGNPRSTGGKTSKKPESFVGYWLEQLPELAEQAAKEVSADYPLKFSHFGSNFLNPSHIQRQNMIMGKIPAELDCFVFVMTYNNVQLGTHEFPYTEPASFVFKVYRTDICS